MATFFGEVVLPSSRAFFDDYDDSDIEDSNYLDNIRERTPIECQRTLKYDTFIIAEGPVATGFAQMYFLNNDSKLIQELRVLEEAEDQGSLSDSFIIKPRVGPSKVYALSNNSVLLLVSEEINLEKTNQIAQAVETYSKNSTRIISLVSQHVSNYRCESVNDLPPAFVRGLATSAQLLPSSLKHLEQPNFISNTSASIMCWCEASQKTGLMLVLYSDQTAVDTVTISAMSKAFNEAGLSKYIINTEPRAVYDDPLKNMNKSFMYM